MSMPILDIANATIRLNAKVRNFGESAELIHINALPIKEAILKLSAMSTRTSISVSVNVSSDMNEVMKSSIRNQCRIRLN